MAFSAKIEVQDTATVALVAVRRKLAPATVNKIAAREGQKFTRQHYINLNRTRPNALGGERTNFYAGAARGTSASSDENGATISINKLGIRQRLYGGTILPKNGKFLTIPAIAVAHGKRAREFGDLKFAFVDDGSGRPRRALAKDGKAYFWLASRVVQMADPSVLPNLGDMTIKILAALQQLIRIREAKA